MYNEQHWQLIENRINGVVAKVNAKIRIERLRLDGDLLDWFIDFKQMIMACWGVLDSLKEIQLAHVNDETVLILDRMKQQFDYTSTKNLKDSIQNFLSTIDQFKIQIDIQAILATDEANCFLKLLDNRVEMLEIQKPILEKILQIPKDKLAQLDIQKTSILKTIKEFIYELMESGYLLKSETVARDLDQFYGNSHGQSSDSIRLHFAEFDKTFRDLSNEIARSKTIIDAHMNKIHSCIEETTKIMKGTCSEIMKHFRNKPFSVKLKSFAASCIPGHPS